MKKYFIILGVIQLITSTGAIPAGLLFVLDPSGTSMGNSTEMLADSPFSTFLIPGLSLLIVNGFGSIFGALLSFRQKELAGAAGVVLGVILCFWILVQIKIIGLSSFLQPVFFIVGLTEIILGYTITNRKRAK